MAKKKYNPEKMTLEQFEERFTDEKTCIEEIERILWGDENGNVQIVSPYTGSTDVSRHSTIPGKYRDRTTRQWFSYKKGTFMENSNLKAKQWLRIIYEMVVNVNGVSSYNLALRADCTQSTAWFARGRVLTAMQQNEDISVDGDIEADECYIGGIDHWRSDSRKESNAIEGTGQKMVVVGFKQRNGIIWAKHVPNADSTAVAEHIAPKLSRKCRFITDESPIYDMLDMNYTHLRVCHSKDQYVNGNVHVQGIEGFWGRLKKMIDCTYIAVSGYHLNRYIDEKVFQQNTNTISKKEKFELVLKRRGCRLRRVDLIQPGRDTIAFGPRAGQKVAGKRKNLFIA